MTRLAIVGLLLLFKYAKAVVDGSDAETSRYPYFAVIVRPTTNSFCGGVVVHDDILLSTAHCVLMAAENRDDGLEYVVDSDDIVRNRRVVINPSTREEFVDQDDETSGFLRITQVLLHPSFGALDPRLHRTEHDLVAYRINTTTPLASAVLNSDVSHPTPDQTVTVLGYGATRRNGRDNAPVLQQSPLRVVSPALCEAWYTNLHDANLDICAQGENGSNACFGDSGGPLVIQGDNNREDRVVGIVVHGPEEVIDSNATELCGDPAWPEVYARVSAYTDWVNGAICNMSQWPPASCTEEEATSPPIDAMIPPVDAMIGEAPEESSTTALLNIFELLPLLLLLLTTTNKVT